MSALATDQARKIAATAGITTEQAMFAKAPEVTRLRHAGAAEAIVGDVLGRIACPVLKIQVQEIDLGWLNPVMPISIPSWIRSSGNSASSIESCSRFQPALWAIRLSASIRARFLASLRPSRMMAGIDSLPSDWEASNRPCPAITTRHSSTRMGAPKPSLWMLLAICRICFLVWVRAFLGVCPNLIDRQVSVPVGHDDAPFAGARA